jgi:hypothetical protein
MNAATVRPGRFFPGARRRAGVGALVGCLALVSAACSGGGGDRVAPTTTAAPRRPLVAPATLQGPITVGEISPPADPKPVDLAAAGYVQEEFFASGTARAFAADGPLAADGRWRVKVVDAAPFTTRLVVRRPRDPARFSGTVVVEWLNVSAVEAAPEWAYTHRAILDARAAWVGVSAQALGVVGGRPLIQVGAEELAQQQAQASQGIKGSNPERYGSLAHPGDRFAFDIFSRVGAALRAPGGVPVFGGASARQVIAAGESQSAAYLTGYLNAVHRGARVFDGFFVHSRGAGAALPDGSLEIRGAQAAYRVRTDLDAPVMIFETETDVGPLLRYATARQPDTARIRTWEVAGTAHADAYLVGPSFAGCAEPINTGPQHYVATAAMAALIRWVQTGAAPPRAEPIRTGGPEGVSIIRDEHGLALGGVRTPSVDVPVAALSGEAPAGGSVLCALFGSSRPFDAATLRTLYGTRDAYVAAFDRALDRAVAAGFVRGADRPAYAAEARAVEF